MTYERNTRPTAPEQAKLKAANELLVKAYRLRFLEQRTTSALKLLGSAFGSALVAWLSFHLASLGSADIPRGLLIAGGYLFAGTSGLCGIVMLALELSIKLYTEDHAREDLLHDPEGAQEAVRMVEDSLRMAEKALNSHRIEM